MTEQQQHGLVGAVQDIGGKIVASLPAQFLALVLMTLVFNLGMIWFVDRQNAARERVLGPILTSCMMQAPGEIIKQLMERRE